MKKVLMAQKPSRFKHKLTKAIQKRLINLSTVKKTISRILQTEKNTYFRKKKKLT